MSRQRQERKTAKSWLQLQPFVYRRKQNLKGYAWKDVDGYMKQENTCRKIPWKHAVQPVKGSKGF